MRTLALAIRSCSSPRPAAAQAPARSSAKAVSGQLIVGFEKKVSSDRQRAVLKKLGAKIHKRLTQIRAAAIRPRSGSRCRYFESASRSTRTSPMSSGTTSCSGPWPRTTRCSVSRPPSPPRSGDGARPDRVEQPHDLLEGRGARHRHAVHASGPQGERVAQQARDRRQRQGRRQERIRR